MCECNVCDMGGGRGLWYVRCGYVYVQYVCALCGCEVCVCGG